MIPEDHDPYGKDVFPVYPGGGLNSVRPEPAPAPNRDAERLDDLTRLVEWYEERKFLTVSFEIEDAKWLIQRARGSDEKDAS